MHPSGELPVLFEVPVFMNTKLEHGVPPHTRAPDRAAHQLRFVIEVGSHWSGGSMLALQTTPRVQQLRCSVIQSTIPRRVFEDIWCDFNNSKCHSAHAFFAPEDHQDEDYEPFGGENVMLGVLLDLEADPGDNRKLTPTTLHLQGLAMTA